ncbi:Condensin complex subunit 1 [Daldinia childiae]|uniref:Condensin complex subunit 1 n=1 Tax=Daldinia childiae TaxID=326645 RepID=UPI001445EFD3|nr:Condensin complex subunit 1 [Daldinia childiae]KAF3066398.1 Condensin complex subunit 1 [Daldinia childiae]
MDPVNFDINEALMHYMSDPASIATPEADGALVDCESDPESLSNISLLNSVLNPIVDAVAGNPDAIMRSAYFDSLQFLLKCAPTSIAPPDNLQSSQSSVSRSREPISKLFLQSRYTQFLPTHALSKIFDLIMSGLAAEADTINHDLENPDEQEIIAHHKSLLEIYGFLLQWTIACVETKAAEKSSTAPVSRARGKGAKSKTTNKDKDGTWDSVAQLQSALDVMSKVLKLKLGKIFLTTSERDNFIGLLTRPVYLVLESEQRVKNTAIKMHAFKVLCIAVKHHGHGYAAQISIVQNLTYFEHLSEPMAEFLHILAEQYDYPQLADEILREISNKEFNTNDTKGPKSVSSFIVKLSELIPRLVIKQMTMLAKQLDSESYTLRCSLIEVCGNMIAHLTTQEERSENHKSQINAFFDVLEERFLDINPYCRCRAMQVYTRLCELEQKFPKRRQKAAELACRSLEDKSSHVRRNAIKLLGTLIKTHPFTVLHGAQLSRKDWQERLEKVDAQLDALKPPAGEPGLGEDKANATALVDEPTQIESPQKPREMTDEEKVAAVQKAQEDAATSEAIEKLTLTKRYYIDALKFIEVLHEATSTVCQLLGSKNKSEVIEAMDYLEIGNAYNIEDNMVGIRRMMRLIWTKGNSDEGKGVQSHLIDCYRRLFFEAPDSFSPNDAAIYIARNMISLTSGTTPAELTSLEQLIATMMKGGMISDRVVTKLWEVYGFHKREISRSQRRGAIIVLGMLATASPEIVVGEMETMLRTGLGSHGRADLQLAKYTCIALQRLNPTGRQAKDSTVKFSRLPNEHAVLARLAAITEVPSDSKEWFGVAEQAINAIYTLAKHPDTLCSEIIRRRTKVVFSAQQKSPSTSRPGSRDQDFTVTATVDQGITMGLDAPTQTVNRLTSEPPAEPKQKAAIALSQLLFIVGHVAIKQIVHLELCELDFKRRKQEKEKDSAAKPAAPRPSVGRKGKTPAPAVEEEGDELDLIGGTTEDDFTEAMAHIREQELLFGPQSLLSSFGPLVAEICSRSDIYRDKGLQAAATLCLAKLMCVSSEYCEAHLPLLITIMERSPDATVRSNVVIALGDMAVCFNHLIDENTDFLYRRLADRDLSVKRTCLMTLTFLILAGQVKVKGQLGEMAKCLEDEDKRIADLARMFFTELSTKDNAVYNHFVDMFSLLSADRRMEPEPFRRIVKFLLGFVEKDKHAKQLAEKLAARLPRCETERQWSDVAFALGLLQHKNEDITKVVSEGFKVVHASA